MTATAAAVKFFAKNDYGLVDMLRPLTREDFGPAGKVQVDTEIGKYGNYARVWQNFDLVTEISTEDIRTFRGLTNSINHRPNDKITISVGLRKDVELRGVRKEKQAEKAGNALCSIMSGFDGEAMLAERIAKINKDTLESISKDTEYNVRQSVLHLRNPSSYKWEHDKNVQQLRAELKELNEKRKAIIVSIDAIQKAEIRKHILENVPEPIKTAAITDLDQKGLHDDSPFGRHI